MRIGDAQVLSTRKLPVILGSWFHGSGQTGEVTIPESIRDKAGLEPDVAVNFEPVDGGVMVRRNEKRSGLRGRFAGSGMATRLLEDRR